jgi:hypothetical protein
LVAQHYEEEKDNAVEYRGLVLFSILGFFEVLPLWNERLFSVLKLVVSL